jgi:hypothetical protein
VCRRSRWTDPAFSQHICSSPHCTAELSAPCFSSGS